MAYLFNIFNVLQVTSNIHYYRNEKLPLWKRRMKTRHSFKRLLIGRSLYEPIGHNKIAHLQKLVKSKY